MEIYRKNNLIRTEAQANALLDELDDFIANPEPGKPWPRADAKLVKIWNNGDRLEWKWSEESLQEYEQRTAREKAEADLLGLHKANLEAWKDAKIRPVRDVLLFAWIDETFIKPLLYALTSEQETERMNKRQELLDWPETFTEWADDAAIDAAKPAAPSWISE